MNLEKIKYKIAMYGSTKEVEGYAIDCDLPVRLCVRPEGRLWRVDHYDTGYFIGKLCHSRQQAIAHGIEVISQNIQSGKYADMIRAYNQRPGTYIHVL